MKQKRLYAWLLSLVMMFSLLPTAVLAAKEDESVEDESVRYGQYVDGVWKSKENDTGKVKPNVNGVNSVSKTAKKTADNTYEVTLKVEMEQTTTTAQPGAAATVLVMDVSNSMDYCAECGKKIISGADHASGCTYKYKSKYVSRLKAAQAAAREFLKIYSGRFDENGQETRKEALDLGRYVSLVAFSTGAEVKVDWVDVSNADGYQDALDAVDGLKANGGTNLEQGFVKANDQLKQDTVKNISEKNVIALADGVPTFYGEASYSILSGWTAEGHGDIGCPDTNAATEEAASALKASPTSAKLYTVCFGAADTKCWEKGSPHGIWVWQKHESDGPTVGEFLSKSIATNEACAYNAGNTDDLMKEFKAITDTITTGLNAGTVTDSLPACVSTKDAAFVEGKMTWVLNANDKGVEKNSDEASGKTTYTWTKSYTVTIDPTKVAAGTPYQPLNNPTTLKVTVNGQEKEVAFPIPAGKVVPLKTLTVSGEDYVGTYDGEKHGDAAMANNDKATIEYSTDGGESWSESVPTITNVGVINVLVRATLNGYEDAHDAYTLTVDYANVTVTAENKLVEPGSDVPEYTADVTGLVHGEPKSWIDYTISCAYTKNTAAGTSLPITVTGDEIQGNYRVTYKNGQLDVHQDAPGTADVEVRFYKDSVNEENRLDVIYIEDQVVGSGITLDSSVIDRFKPDGYDGGVQQGVIPYIVKNGENVIEVVYPKTVPTTGRVVIMKMVRGVDAADLTQIQELTFNVKKDDAIVESDSLHYYDGTKLTTAAIDLGAGSYNLSEDLNKAMNAIPGYELVGVHFAETGKASESAVQTDTDNFTSRYGDYNLTIHAGVTAHVTCINTYEKKEVESDTYTVTYTDGANGSAFDDQVYQNLDSGAETPKFNGTPARSGYTFNGWDPAVAETVTGDALYRATWTKNSSGDDGGDDSDTYYYVVKKVDAQDGHVLKGAKFGLYVDDKQIATATSSSEGYALFSLDERVYNRLDKDDEIYYTELTAPDGYIKSSREYTVSVDNFVKNSVLSAKRDADTVKNSSSSTPDQLNDEDHFAYVIGYKDGNVRPYGLISRAETTTIFFRLLKDSVRDGNLLTSNTYTDVADNYWANTAISTMTGLGIVQGRTATTFDPYAPITRAQFAAICARFDDGKTQGGQTFTDIQGHWAQVYIERAAELGWIKGFEDGTFRPDAYITRAQAMTMINRVLNRIPEDADDLLSNMNVWPDCNPGDWFYLAVHEATNSHDYKHKAGNYETWSSMNKDPDWTRYEN